MKNRQKQEKEIRRQINRLPYRPRLCITKSNKHIYAQVIDDLANKTLCACSTLTRRLKPKMNKTYTCEAAWIIGETIAKLSIQSGIKYVVFDRRNCLYHGKIKAVADAARTVGLNF